MFELHITCTKDIDTLSINFSDGTSVVTESSKPSKKVSDEKFKEPREQNESKEVKPQKELRKKLDTYLDTEDDYEVQQEVIQKPIIQEVHRPAKVSDELQNLDI